LPYSGAIVFACLAVAFVPPAFSAEGWVVDRPREGVFVLRDENGVWGGPSMGVAHQNQPKYQARKTLDLSALPPGTLDKARAVRLRMYFGIQDYSWNMANRKYDGLDESFEIVVNGHAQRFKTSDPRFPSRRGRGDKLKWDWVDIDVPVERLKPGENEVIIRKRPGGGDDDYIYPGIDNTANHGHSAVSFDGGKTWHTDRLNTIKAQGEYMIRLAVATVDLEARVTWRPSDVLDDPGGLIVYAGKEDSAWVFEPGTDAYDRAGGLVATVTFAGPRPKVTWRDVTEKPLRAAISVSDSEVVAKVPAARRDAGSLLVRPMLGTTVRQVVIEYTRSTQKPAPVVNLRPDIAPPRGKRGVGRPACRLTANAAVLENAGLRATFQTRPTLSLQSLHVAEIDRNVLAKPESTHLFRLKIGEKVYGCRDGAVREIKPIQNGFVAALDIARTGLRVTFTATVDERELRLGLEVANAGPESVTFYSSFPHLDGLVLSDESAEDYYLFPWFGGVIANVPASLRSAYGENSCWWQMIDLFSPPRGGGLYVRVDDPTGLYKSPALRKGKTADARYRVDASGNRLRAEMLWKTSLDPGVETGFTFDYLRRTRGSGGSFCVPSACLGSHAGDWRAALKTYADWSHRTWPPRPYPSALTSRWNILAPGWGKAALFKDGAYRTEYLRPHVDVAEMMSWWSWSDKGPWGVLMDRVEQELGAAFYKRYKHYWVNEPATGQLMYPLNRGDYDGYMPQWGGLPALRAHIKRVREAGVLPTFYIEGILACANTKVGSTYGPTYGVMNPDWKDHYKVPKTPKGYVGSYGSYNMCSDTEWWPDYLAKAVARVCRETGIDGVRLDEYGHRGYVCFNPRHKHIFAERGHNAWMQAVARACKLVHEKMDEVRPGLVLMTEFPGNDHLAASLDGAITYQASARRVNHIRPTPCSLFRFFFRSCKLFEINRPSVRQSHAWSVWNGNGAFGYAFTPKLHTLMVESTDAFEGDRVEPLVPTLRPLVYANRFEGGGKTILTLHNATGHTVDGPLIAVSSDAAHHFVELLNGRELKPAALGDRWTLALMMKRDTTAVIARLPRLLTVAGGRISVQGAPVGSEIVVAAGNGERLTTLKPGTRVAPVLGQPRPVMIKLIREGRLVDAIPYPGRRS